MPNILAFTTYPVKFPLHGGQRRISAFAQFYKRLGFDYESVCVYETGSYTLDKVGPFDLPLKYCNEELNDVPFVGDLLSGIYGSEETKVVEHFYNLVLRKAPSAIVLDQPFMWPMIAKLRSDPVIANIPLIYSSQNWEAPLKLEILLRSGVNHDVAYKIHRVIDKLERSLTRACQLIFACCEPDAKIYRSIAPDKPVIVVKNGVNRPSEELLSNSENWNGFMGLPFLFFVGSAYPPNIDGVCSLLLDGGLFFMPPRKGLAICGGASEGIFQDRRYQRFLASNNDRVNFYSEISDLGLDSLKSQAHAVILPINFGGGSNLKTAEALASGKWIVATTTAMRGFEDFVDAPGVIVADGPYDFRKAVVMVFNSIPLELSEADKLRREMVYWDRCFDHVRREDLSLFEEVLS